MFERPHHQQIAAMLARFNGMLLAECSCAFAGGTAVAMQIDEYRRSDDIDLLCASIDGYRRIREIVFEQGLGGLAKSALPVLREARSDQYGIRAVLGEADAPVKFEIVREGRIALSLDTATIGGVPLLGRDDMYAEKLLANADRGLDGSTLHRDLIDLCMMIHAWGPIPATALDKARGAYGQSIDRALQDVAAVLLHGTALRDSLRKLDVDVASVMSTVKAVLAGLASSSPVDPTSRRRGPKPL